MSVERVQRRLAAILSADVVGYSRLMGIDEAGTLARLKVLRRDIIDPMIATHAGRMVKLMGDGALVEFASAVDAVTCAIEIQKRIREHSAGGLEDNRIEFRIGINIGDIIVDGDDIYGDGVNVAARIQSLADPGGIYISRSAAEQVRDKVPITIETRGEQTVKNIARPIEVFCIVANGRDTVTVALPARVDRKPPAIIADKPSIAVLPFSNMSGDHDQEYFSDGISEDVITNLSRNRAFFVISRSTSFTYKGAAVDVARVARELGVRYVLEGSVRRAGNRVRITAQLIDAATGHHLWADRYDRELADVFVVQDEIARNISGAIAPGIIAAEMQHSKRKDPSQLDAWDRIMRAHWHIRRFTHDDLGDARRLLTEAIALDPSNSIAYSDLAIARHFEAVFGWGDGPAASHERLGEAARKAVALDESDAAAHTALAIHDLFSGRHEESRRRLRRALDLDPNSVFARGYLGTSYSFSGDYDSALPHLDEAIRLSPRDPLLIIWHLCRGWVSLFTKRYEEAIEFAGLAAEANPEFPDIYMVLAAANGHLDRRDAAQAALKELSQRMPNLTASDERLNRPLERAAHRMLFLEGLRKAGMSA